ncbi:hypothetical protein ATCC90586_011518 [Pythium insidiosum]|nr:hypothetical protein ATCC90586_011518 [Pythium insidiosum]
MDDPRLMDDALLLQKDEPQHRALQLELARVTHGAGLHVESGAAETTPLLRPSLQLMAGADRVVLDDDRAVDLKDLLHQLCDEEHAAVTADLRAPAMDIVWDECHQLWQLAIPLFLVTVTEYLPQTLLTMMVGRSDAEHSTQILAGTSLTNLFQLLLVQSMLMGIGSAVDTVCSQAYGGKRLVELWLFSQAGLIVYLLYMPFVSLLLLNANPILLLLGQPPTIAAIAAKLLVLNFVCLPFAIVFSVAKSALQAQNIVQPFMTVSIISWGVSLPIAYVLGFHTSLGYVGVLLSTVVNAVVKALAILPIVIRNDTFRSAWPGWQWRRALSLVPQVARLGASSVLMVLFQSSSSGFIQLLAGLLPNAATVMSANSIFSTMMMFVFMPLMGICIAAAVRIGNALGAGQARRASLIGTIAMVAALVVATLGLLVFVFIAPSYARSFTTNTSAVEETLRLFRSQWVIIPLQGFTFGIQGILRGTGRQWVCALLKFIFLLVCGVPLGFVLARHLQLNLIGLWMGHTLGTLGFAVAGTVWVCRLPWVSMALEARRSTHLRVVALGPKEDAEPEAEAEPSV